MDFLVQQNRQPPFKAVRRGFVLAGQPLEAEASLLVEQKADGDAAVFIGGFVSPAEILARHAVVRLSEDDQKLALVVFNDLSGRADVFGRAVGVAAHVPPTGPEGAVLAEQIFAGRQLLDLIVDVLMVPPVREEGEFQAAQAGHLAFFAFDDFGRGFGNDDFNAVRADFPHRDLFDPGGIQPAADGGDHLIHHPAGDLGFELVGGFPAAFALFDFFLDGFFIHLIHQVGAARQIDPEVQRAFPTSGFRLFRFGIAGDIEHIQAGQSGGQIGQAFIGDFRIADPQIAEALQLFEMLEALIGDVGVADVQCFQTF